MLLVDWACYRCILHLQQYSHRLNLFFIFSVFPYLFSLYSTSYCPFLISLLVLFLIPQFLHYSFFFLFSSLSFFLLTLFTHAFPYLSLHSSLLSISHPKKKFSLSKCCFPRASLPTKTQCELRRPKWNYWDLWQATPLMTHKTNDSIGHDLQTECTLDKIDEYRKNWLLHLQRMPQNRIPLKSYHYSPQGKRTMGRPKKRWREQL